MTDTWFKSSWIDGLIDEINLILKATRSEKFISIVVIVNPILNEYSLPEHEEILNYAANKFHIKL